MFALRLLRRALESLTGKPVHESGTMVGQLHRAYTEVIARLATRDGILLNTTEVCERVAVRVYENALEDGAMPVDLLDTLTYQAGHIRRVYEMILDFRLHVRN